MIRTAEVTAALQQVIGHGRVWDSISGRGLPAFDVVLDYAHAGGSGTFPATLVHRTDGWYALQLVPARQMPGLSAAGAVTLTARITAPGREPAEVSRSVTGDRLAVERTQLSPGTGSIIVDRVAGAPWSFSAAVPPRPVALTGVVVRNHDAEDPFPGVTVRVDGVPDVVTDAAGRFFLPALPVAPSVAVTLVADTLATTTEHRPDYSRPVNSAVFSLSG